jgi:hypothetical protein
MKTYFRSNTIYNQSPSSIDKEKGIIRNIVLCQTGEAKGHNLFINEQFIDKVIQLGNDNKAGIKARFGHPNICSTALGTYLGRYKNFRREDNSAVADLFLDQSASKSPNGNLFDYVLGLAESNPDMFGASIAFKAGKVDKRFETIDGVEVEKSYATILNLHACDLVDDPAATDGLFESLHEDDFSFQVTLFLDEHPEIYKLLNNKPEILNEFLVNYKQYKSKDKDDYSSKAFDIRNEIANLKKWITDTFLTKKDSPPLEKTPNAEGSEWLQMLKANFESKITSIESKLKSQESLAEHSRSTEALINSQAETIKQLQSDLNKSKAFPTMPDKMADPKLNIKKKINTDDSGKVLLQNSPDNAKRKLKQKK